MKREINFNEATDNDKGTCNERGKIPQNEHVKTSDSVTKNNCAGVEGNMKVHLENSEPDVSETESKSEETDNTSNQRTQEQAGKGHR